MKRTNHWLLIMPVSAALLAIAAPSRAQEGGGGGGVSTTSSGASGDYGYKFEDDPLAAGGFGPNDATIRVRPGPVRTTLIRPRTSFVPEMLKSVENI